MCFKFIHSNTDYIWLGFWGFDLFWFRVFYLYAVFLEKNLKSAQICKMKFQAHA